MKQSFLSLTALNIVVARIVIVVVVAMDTPPSPPSTILEHGWPRALVGYLTLRTHFTQLTEMLTDDDDPLLDLDEQANEGFVYEPTDSADTSKEGCSFNSYLQGILYHFVAKPVVNYRRFVLGKVPRAIQCQRVTD